MTDMTDEEFDNALKEWKRRKEAARMELAQAIYNTSSVLRTGVEQSFHAVAEPIDFDQALEIGAYVEGVVNDYDDWYRTIQSEVQEHLESVRRYLKDTKYK